MVLRSLVKVVVAAGEAVTKAFARAVREEIKASQQAAARQATSSGSSGSSSEEKEATKANARLGISLQESIQILDVKAPLNPEEVEKRFKHLFEVNEKSKGGSFYLQSKVYCAKQRIDEELRRQEEAKKEE